MSSPDNLPRWSHPIVVAELAPGQTREFSLIPDAGQRHAIADALGIVTIRKLRFDGVLAPLGKADWQLTGDLGATAVQSCVVTLAPVSTRIDQMVQRDYRARLPAHEAGSETEMPDDDTVEPLTTHIDPGQVMLEALALALPQFPRATGAVLGEANFTEPGKVAMDDADARPFAGLRALRDGPKNDTG